jgi:hypothetical protein
MDESINKVVVILLGSLGRWSGEDRASEPKE